MMKRQIEFILLVLISLLLSHPQQAFAKPGDVTHVISHNNCMVVTDPSKGFNAYRHWAVFPPAAAQYRRAVLSVTYRCPDSLHCGEWDYIDAVYLRRTGSQTSPLKDLELARTISPYGSRFGPSWHFTWQVDVTDFAFLFHDSVEIEFNHGGYENNTDRGWLITLDFALTEGPPALPILGMDTLWNGTFPYGDTSKPIERLLRPISFTDRYGARWARLRIVQTGHGMDDSENCAEFCSKTRSILLDDSLRDQRQIWRKCGANPLYPQAGTWLYDRANWCPGSMVYPDIYDFPIAPKSTHVLDIDMQPYANAKTPTANYCIHSYLFYCAAPWAANDVSLLEIAAPSTADDWSRMNPACSNARIVIRNSGRNALRAADIKSGIAGAEQQTFRWEGNLASGRDTGITIPGPGIGMVGNEQFTVTLDSPNGAADEYPADNTLTSEMIAPPAYPTKFVLAFLTNNDSTHNGYEFRDGFGKVVRERRVGSLRRNTAYRDTLDLAAGCFQFVFVDTTGDGLDFWANPEGGYGYVRLLDMNGHLIRSFISDFGSEIRHSFAVAAGVTPPVPGDTLPLISPFPARNQGVFSVEIFQNQPSDLTISIADEAGKRTLFEKVYPNIKEAILPIDISASPDGVYFLKASANGTTATRRIRIKRAG